LANQREKLSMVAGGTRPLRGTGRERAGSPEKNRLMVKRASCEMLVPAPDRDEVA